MKKKRYHNTQTHTLAPVFWKPPQHGESMPDILSWQLLKKQTTEKAQQLHITCDKFKATMVPDYQAQAPIMKGLTRKFLIKIEIAKVYFKGQANSGVGKQNKIEIQGIH